jgi:hypothetical protein
MPIFYPAANYEASFHMGIDGSTQPAICTLGVAYIGTQFSVDAGAIPTAWLTLMAKLSETITFEGFKLRNNLGTIVDLVVSGRGSEVQAALPVNCAYLVKKVTNAPGRRNRGRFYLPGVMELDVDSVGKVSDTRRGTMDAALNAFLGSLSAAQFIATILHHSEDGLTGLQPTEITSLKCDAVIGTQRRRLRG